YFLDMRITHHHDDLAIIQLLKDQHPVAFVQLLFEFITDWFVYTAGDYSETQYYRFEVFEAISNFNLSRQTGFTYEGFERLNDLIFGSIFPVFSVSFCIF